MADAMGLGKTLTMLALITATKADVSEHFSNSTLIGAQTLLFNPSPAEVPQSFLFR